MSHKTVNLFVLLGLFITAPALASQQEKKQLDPAEVIVKRLEKEALRLDAERKARLQKETEEQIREAKRADKEAYHRIEDLIIKRQEAENEVYQAKEEGKEKLAQLKEKVEVLKTQIKALEEKSQEDKIPSEKEGNESPNGLSQQISSLKEKIEGLKTDIEEAEEELEKTQRELTIAYKRYVKEQEEAEEKRYQDLYSANRYIHTLQKAIYWDEIGHKPYPTGGSSQNFGSFESVEYERVGIKVTKYGKDNRLIPLLSPVLTTIRPYGEQATNLGLNLGVVSGDNPNSTPGCGLKKSPSLHGCKFVTLDEEQKEEGEDILGSILTSLGKKGDDQPLPFPSGFSPPPPSKEGDNGTQGEKKPRGSNWYELMESATKKAEQLEDQLGEKEEEVTSGRKTPKRTTSSWDLLGSTKREEEFKALLCNGSHGTDQVFEIEEDTLLSPLLIPTAGSTPPYGEETKEPIKRSSSPVFGESTNETPKDEGDGIF